MKEKIYTIPVTEAFEVECECPLCVLEKRLESESIEYTLGPSLMEPDHRQVSNEKGFCMRHFSQLFNKQSNKLGLGLILDTHLKEQNTKLKKKFDEKRESIKKETELPLLKNVSNRLTAKKTETEKFVDGFISALDVLEKDCTICSKLEYTMERYLDVTFYLWSREEDFRRLFRSKNGFCLRHLKQLLEGAKRYLSARETALFVMELMDMQFTNMERIEEEVNWFTRKFDYRYSNEPWGNSRDALPRGIQKIAGNCDFKE